MPMPPPGYTFITPTQGMNTIPCWMVGNPVTIKWSGGPSGPVTISLINWWAWAVQSVLTPSTPNNGAFNWTVPKGLQTGIYCVYIQNVPPAGGSPTQWHYSSLFAINGPNSVGDQPS